MGLIKYLAFFILFILNSCSSKNETELKIDKKEKVDFEIQTSYGKIGNYMTMDEFYYDEKNIKVYHGYRKNLYPSGSPKIVSFYENGELKWTETYDEVGNIITSNK